MFINGLVFKYFVFITNLQPEKSIPNALDTVVIYNDPYGVVLVIGAWNYPLQLTMAPVAGAIAAGNCVIIKPSEVAPASAKFMAETIPKYLDNVSTIDNTNGQQFPT